MIVWRGRYTGKLARVNEWQKARSIGGKAQTYASPEYKNKKEALAISLIGPASPIADQVDLIVEVTLWKQTDTDAPIKAIMDALEDAGVIENDRQIRDIIIKRCYHPRDDTDGLRLFLVTIDQRIREALWDRLLNECK